MIDMTCLQAFWPQMPAIEALVRVLGAPFCAQLEAGLEAMSEATCPRAVSFYAVRLKGMLVAAELLGHISTGWRVQFASAVDKACLERLTALNVRTVEAATTAARRVH